MPIAVGEMAPDFTLPTAKGEQVQLSALLSRGPAVVYFYPKDDSPGCTAEACSFRDAYEDFKQAGAEVVGISSDAEDAHAAFAGKHRLPFILASDRGGEVRKRYDVRPNFLGLLPGRVTFVIDRQGVVRHVFSSQVNARRHVTEALEVLRGLQ